MDPREGGQAGHSNLTNPSAGCGGAVRHCALRDELRRLPEHFEGMRAERNALHNQRLRPSGVTVFAERGKLGFCEMR